MNCLCPGTCESYILCCPISLLFRKFCFHVIRFIVLRGNEQEVEHFQLLKSIFLFFLVGRVLFYIRNISCFSLFSALFSTQKQCDGDFFFPLLNYLNIMRYVSKTCSNCRTILTFRNLASYIQDGRKITPQMPPFYIYSTNIRTEYFKHAV